jgi:cell division protein FtsX
MYLLKLALRPWRVNPLSQIFFALSVGILLFVGGMLAAFLGNVQNSIAELQKQQVVMVYLAGTLSPEQEKTAVDQIKSTLAAPIADVNGENQKTPELIPLNQNEFLEELRLYSPEVLNELLGLGNMMNSMIPKGVGISGEVGNEGLSKIKSILGVEAVENSRQRFDLAIQSLSQLKTFLLLVSGGLLIVFLTAFVHFARLNGSLFSDLRSLLTLMGARPWYVPIPSIISGVLVGFLGGALASLLWVVFSGDLFYQINQIAGPLGTQGALSSFGNLSEGMFAHVRWNTIWVFLGLAPLFGAVSSVLGDWTA